MKAIEFESESALDLEDANKLQQYNSNVDNVRAERFAEKIKKDGKWYMGFNSELSQYFTQQELDLVETLQFPDNIFI